MKNQNCNCSVHLAKWLDWTPPTRSVLVGPRAQGSTSRQGTFKVGFQRSGNMKRGLWSIHRSKNRSPLHWRIATVLLTMHNCRLGVGTTAATCQCTRNCVVSGYGSNETSSRLNCSSRDGDYLTGRSDRVSVRYSEGISYLPQNSIGRSLSTINKQIFPSVLHNFCDCIVHDVGSWTMQDARRWKDAPWIPASFIICLSAAMIVFVREVGVASTTVNKENLLH